MKHDDDWLMRKAALNAVSMMTIPLDLDPTQALDYAQRCYRFLRGDLPVALLIKIGPLVEQGTLLIHPSHYVHYAGGTMPQMKDTQQFSIHVDAVDAKGVEVVDSFTASVADEAVCTLVAEADSDTWTVVAGLPGSTVVTVTDGTLSATLAVDVIAGDVVAIQIVAGDIVDQPPVEPPA